MEIMHVADGGGADWEAELNRLASMETETELPYAQAISDALLDISNVLRGVTADGIEGDTGDAARAAFNNDANDAAQLSDDVATLIQNLRTMNSDRRILAREHCDALDAYPEALNSDDEYQLCTAETGSTWQLGPLTFTITDGIIGALNTFFRAQRHARAQEGVKAVADRMDYWAQQFNTQRRLTTPSDLGDRGMELGDEGASTGGDRGSFDMYPGSGGSPAGYVPPGITYTPPTDDGTGDAPFPTVPTFPATPPSDYPDDDNYQSLPLPVPGGPDRPVLVGSPLPAYPTVPPGDVISLPGRPDYPTGAGGTDYPDVGYPNSPWTPGRPDAWEPTYSANPDGWDPTRPGYPGGDEYSPYVPGGNGGSSYQPYDPSRPDGPGTDGGQHRAALTSDSTMGNGSHGWGTGTSTGRGTGVGIGIGIGSAGGLPGGGAGIGGASAGVGIGGAGSAGLIGGAGGAVSLAGAKLIQTGLNGSHGASSLTTAPGASGAATRSGGGMGMMAGGAGGGQSTGSKSRRGLSGLVAPHLDDDDEPFPRSEAAGAGGRE